MRRAAPAIALALAACAHSHARPAAVPAPGIAISLYANASGHDIAMIDDRRWIDVTGDRLVLDDLDAGVALPSLVLEALSGPGTLVIDTCARDHLKLPVTTAADATPMPSGLGDLPVPPPPPIAREPMQELRGVGAGEEFTLASSVHCAVHGPAGRYLVRVLYSSTTLAYHAEHEIAVTSAGHAHIETHLAVTTPAWHPHGGEATSAQVTAYDGIPGADRAPVELARGRIALDGSIGVLAMPARDAPARIRRVLTPSLDANADDEPEALWLERHRGTNGDEPDALVWVWLEIPGVQLAPGLVRVRVSYPGEDDREAVVTPDNRTDGSADAADATGSASASPATTGPLRLALWADEDLRADIQRRYASAGDDKLLEKFQATLSNIGEQPHEVYVEEKLRPTGKRTVTNAFPGKPGLVGNTLRVKLVVVPAKVERAGFVVTYQLER